MQIINELALLVRTRTPAAITTVIPQSQLLGTHDVLVKWSLDNARILRNLGYANTPSPIRAAYEWPGRFKPFKHQYITSEFLSLHKRAFCLNQQGLGKSASALWAADFLMQQGVIKRALIIAPLSILYTAWMDEVFNTVIHRTVGVAYGDKETRRKVINGDSEFVVINHDGIKLVAEDIANAKFDLIIADECFPAGTQISTPRGTRAIETLVEGDVVLTSAGARSITRTFKHQTQTIVTLELNNGKRIQCTPNHPIFTDVGWVSAEHCAGRCLLDISTVSDVQNGIHASDIAHALVDEKSTKSGTDLLAILRAETTATARTGEMGAGNRHTPRSFSTRKQQRQSVAVGGQTSSESTPRGETDKEPGRKRNRNGALRGAATLYTTRQLFMELRRKIRDTRSWVSEPLQIRFRLPRIENWYRSGWPKSQYSRTPRTGSEKRTETGRVRVDSVTCTQPSCSQDVYNIEIADCPHYFANGILVHNCNAFKTSTSQRWKTLNALIRPETWVWLMTGTPAPQSPLDAYGLVKLIQPKNVPSYFSGWRELVMKKISTFRWVPRPEAKDLVHNALQPAIRFEKKDCLDLPPLTYVMREVELTPQQKHYYTVLKNNARAILDSGLTEINAVNAAALMTKLLQTAAGCVYGDNDKIVQFDISSRLSVIKEIIEDAEGKVLIAVPYVQALKRLAEELSKDYTLDLIYGDVPAGQRADIIRKFQNEATPQLLLMQPNSAAHGITLTEADTIIWYSPTTSFEIYSQFNARIDRPGQKRKMTVFQLQGCDTEKKLNAALRTMNQQHLNLMELYTEVLA